MAYDFSPSFYIQLAQTGFIATACHDLDKQEVLLPEMQFEYALLDFKHLHISKKVAPLVKKESLKLTKNRYFEEVVASIQTYHKKSWLLPKYTQLLRELFTHTHENFELCSFELIDETSHELIAGELGYIIGRTYTSLTGFFKKEKRYNHHGKLQLVLLARYLEQQGFDFWNLGHACMEYKLQLGAKVYTRQDFLRRWLESTKKL